MNEAEKIYAIRYRRQAQADVEEILVSLAERIDYDHAAAWYLGFQNALASLGTLPKRLPIADEIRFFQNEVRVFLFRQTPRGASFRIFYTVIESEEDVPYVYILHVRHGSRKPVTWAEARGIEEE